MLYTTQKGFALPALLGIIALLLVAGGGVYLATSGSSEKPPADSVLVACTEEAKLCSDGSSVSRIGPDCEFALCPDEEKDTSMTETGHDDTMMAEEGGESMMEISFAGTLLGGSLEKSPLIDFNKADYDKAIASEKLVVLYFYANWCPSCKVEFPKMQSAFNQLEDSNAVAFRVNYNDNETDSDEKALARQYGVAYQHTKVFIKDSKQVLKTPTNWETSQYLSNIMENL